MNSDIRLSVDFWDHPKTLALEKLLGPLAPDAVLKLWCWAARYRSDGRLTKMTPTDIAAAARWNGDPDAFVAALLQTRWLDKSAPNRSKGIAIHGWEERQQYVINAPLRAASARKAAQLRWQNRDALGMRTASNPQCGSDADRNAPSPDPLPVPDPSPVPDPLPVPSTRATSPSRDIASTGRKKPSSSTRAPQKRNSQAHALQHAAPAEDGAEPVRKPEPEATANGAELTPKAVLMLLREHVPTHEANSTDIATATSFVDRGWTLRQITAGLRLGLSRIANGYEPPRRLSYFEKPITEAVKGGERYLDYLLKTPMPERTQPHVFERLDTIAARMLRRGQIAEPEPEPPEPET